MFNVIVLAMLRHISTAIDGGRSGMSTSIVPCLFLIPTMREQMTGVRAFPTEHFECSVAHLPLPL